jgi:hypothetical protein
MAPLAPASAIVFGALPGPSPNYYNPNVWFSKDANPPDVIDGQLPPDSQDNQASKLNEGVQYYPHAWVENTSAMETDKVYVAFYVLETFTSLNLKDALNMPVAWSTTPAFIRRGKGLNYVPATNVVGFKPKTTDHYCLVAVIGYENDTPY